MKKRIYIYLRACLMIVLTTTNVYFISNRLYVGSIILSGFISTMWTLNVKDLAISDWYDRLSYILGGITGTTITLYFIRGLVESLIK